MREQGRGDTSRSNIGLPFCLADAKWLNFVATAFVKSSLGLLTCKINAVVYRIFQHVQLLFDHTSEQTKAAVFLLTVLLSKHFVDTTDDDHLLVDNNVAQ